MINPISDGQPITYDLLNQIISQVNDVTSYTDDVRQIIEIYGRGIGLREGNKIGIAVGSIVVSVPPNTQNIDKDVADTFHKVTFNEKPYITATVVDQRAKGGQGIQASIITITDLSKEGFKGRVSLINQIETGTTINVHYIAIGEVSNS